QGKLDPLIVRIELEGFAILPGALLELTPPVRQVAPEDVARDTVLESHAFLDGLLLLWRVGAVEYQEGSDVIGKPGEFGEVLVHRIMPDQAVKFHVRMVIVVQARCASRVPPQRVSPHSKALQKLPGGGDVHLSQVALYSRLAPALLQERHVDAQWLQRPDQQRVALKTVQPQGGVGIDVLEGAGYEL